MKFIICHMDYLANEPAEIHPRVEEISSGCSRPGPRVIINKLKEDLLVKKRNKLLRAFSLLGQDAQPEPRNSNKVSIYSILGLVR